MCPQPSLHLVIPEPLPAHLRADPALRLSARQLLHLLPHQCVPPGNRKGAAPPGGNQHGKVRPVKRYDREGVQGHGFQIHQALLDIRARGVPDIPELQGSQAWRGQGQVPVRDLLQVRYVTVCPRTYL